MTQIHVALTQQADEAMRRNDAERLAEIAEQFIAAGIASSLGKGLYFKGVSERMRGDLVAALSTLDEAADVIRSAGDHFALGDVEMSVGLIHWMSGDLPRALAHLEHALDIQRSHTPDRNEAAILGNIGLVHKDMGDHKEAIRWFHLAIDDARRHGLSNAEAAAQLNIGMIYAEIGDHDSSTEALMTARGMFQQQGNERALLHVDLHHAMVLAESGDHTAAVTRLHDVLERARSIGDRHMIPQVLHTLATTAHRADLLDDVETYLDQLDEFRPLPGAVETGATLLRGMLAQHRGDHARAQDILLPALENAESSQNRTMQLRLHQALMLSAKELTVFEAYVRHSEAAARLEQEVRGADVQRTLALERHRQESEARRLEIERHRKILYSTLPPHVADRVLRGESVNDSFDHAAILFMDMVGFTTMSSSMAADDVVSLLSEIFTTCDAIMAEHGMLKIKTIGDSYMAASLSNTEDRKPKTIVVDAANAAIALLRTLDVQHPQIQVRIGLHCGPVTAGVIGTERLQYDVWGDTVNVASRMESHGEPGRIHVSEAFADALCSVDTGRWTVDNANDSMTHDSLTLRQRGVISIKGKGPMTTYWLG